MKKNDVQIVESQVRQWDGLADATASEASDATASAGSHGAHYYQVTCLGRTNITKY